ncbi:MAG: hypothetical protein AB2804_17930 [Candidatus Thiodiazotropha endolucinida]
MTQSTQSTSPLRRHMLEEMRLCKFSTKTQTGYIRSPACVPTSWPDRRPLISTAAR